MDKIENEVKEFLSLCAEARAILKQKNNTPLYSSSEETIDTNSLPSDKAKFPVTLVGEFCGGEEVSK